MANTDFKVGDFITPIEGKHSSNYNDLTGVRLLKVISILNKNYCKKGLICRVIDGKIQSDEYRQKYYSQLGINESNKTIKVYSDAFELVENTGNYDIF